MKTDNRRGFLKKTAAVGTALGLAPGLTAGELSNFYGNGRLGAEGMLGIQTIGNKPYQVLAKDHINPPKMTARLRWWVIEQWQKHMFNDFTREETLNYLYNTMGYSPGARIPLDELPVRGMGPEYVYDEVKRCVDSIKDDTEVIAGIGIDVMWHGERGNPQPYPSDPIELQKAVFKAVDAGASGILASRNMMKCGFQVCVPLERLFVN